jgi:hypothetical protein
LSRFRICGALPPLSLQGLLKLAEYLFHSVVILLPVLLNYRPNHHLDNSKLGFSFWQKHRDFQLAKSRLVLRSGLEVYPSFTDMQGQ